MNTQPITIVCALALMAASAGQLHAADGQPHPSSSMRHLAFATVDEFDFAVPEPGDADQRGDDLYRQGRDLIDSGQFDRAIAEFRKLADSAQGRADAAMYWIAYAQNKLNQRAEALRTLAELQRQFKSSRWARDGRALEVEIRQASGQKLSPDAENDDELKLLVLTTMSHSDPARTMAALEPLLANPQTSTRVKDRALFVLSQMDDPNAKQILAKVAKDASNADLQSRAVKYIGIVGGDQNRQLLAEVYGSASDQAVKRAVLRSLMLARDHERLLNLAKTEASPELRHEAIRQLGVLGAQNELNQLYRTETVVDLRKQILQAMFIGGDVNDLVNLAKTEKDPQLRRVAVRNLGLIGAPATGDTLLSIYNADQDPEIRKAVVDALFVQNNAHGLVALARAEKNPEMKKSIVSKLALMHSKEATDYLTELLK